MMKRQAFKTLVAAVGIASALVWSALAAEGPNGSNRSRTPSLNHTLGTPRYQILNINNLWTWFRSDGQSNHSPTGGDGCYFPRGTKWVIYEDGLVWGGKPRLDSLYALPPANQEIRVGGATYNVGTQAGWIEGSGANATPAPDLPAVRMYRIRRDYKEMSQAELARDAAEFFEKLLSDVTQADIDLIKQQYERDWTEWPVDRGAPYIERNGTPGYQPPPRDATAKQLIEQHFDEPGVAGADPNSPADQVVWAVFNDLNPSLTQGLYGSEPLGLEVQMTLWGYKRTDAIGNLYFKRYRIINKGGVITSGTTRGSFWIDSMYVSQWSDPDLGAFGDDLCGSDSVLSLGFVYNGNAIDSEFRKFNLAPPAVGYDFLAGPIVRGAATDTAVFDLKYRAGFKNLGLTSFAYFSAGSGISDPPFSYEGTLRWWRMLQGYVPDPSTSPWRLYPSGPFPPSFYPLSGDPVARTGFIDGLGTSYSFAPGDRRIVLNSGPFRLAPGDTQEVVVGTVAGLGSDRLSSVAVMKFNDKFVQNTFNALFQVPKPPAAPDVKVSELDGEVILEWGSNLTRVQETETVVNQPGAYKFEGYNVYQLPSRSSRLSEGKRIITYDLPTDPAVVLDEQFDPISGQILQLPVQFGSNSGVTRYFRFNRDYVRDINKLINGQEYYLAVTAYSVATQAGFLPRALESDVQVLTVRPRVPFGTVYGSRYGDTLKVNHIRGISDGVVRPIVVDPTRSTGHTYQVKFDTTGGVSTWLLLNITTGDTVISRETNQSGDENYKLLEGMFLKVEGPLPGLKRQDQIDTDDSTKWGWKVTRGVRRFTWSNADGLGFEGFRGAAGWASPNTVFGGGTPFYSAAELKAIEIRLANADTGGVFDSTQQNVSKAYRYGRNFAAAPAQPGFLPWMINRSGGYSYQDFRRSAPLAVYDIDANPPRRLAVGYLENNAPGGRVDGKYFPPDNSVDNTASTGPREWLFIFGTDYSETPDPSYQVEAINNRLPIMYFITWNRRGNVPFTDQDAIALIPARVNTVNDIFEFKTPAPQKGVTYEKKSAEKVGVFPNPYYAFNPAETNRLVRFVTFNNLPPQATVRIFNLAGHKVRTLQKNDPSQFLRWDLNNDDNFPVASGMYIAHIEMTLPSDRSKVTKVLKIAVIQEQEVPDVF